MQLKVCGMTDIGQVHELDAIGVHFCGFIFYPKSPRYVLSRGLTPSLVKQAKIQACKVGVFVDAAYDQIMQQVSDFGLDTVQLHGNESPETCARVAQSIPVIKAFGVNEEEDIVSMVKDYYDAAGHFLFDTGKAVHGGGAAHDPQYGGTGKKFNWEQIKDLELGKPFLLSGGIAPGDAPLLKSFYDHPVAQDLFAIDINSRFECEPGKKNIAQVSSFFNALNDITPPVK